MNLEHSLVRSVVAALALAVGLAACEAPSPAPAPGPAAQGDTRSATTPTAAAPPDTHGQRNAGRKAPDECENYGAAAPTTPPTPLFDANDTRAQGTDVSDAQGDVPWRGLHEGGVEFVYIRATEGRHIQDKHFARNWKMARACGLPRGAYHVFEPTQDVDTQVDNFLGQLGDDHGELPVALDIEITPEMVAARNKRHHTSDVFPAQAEYVAGILAWIARVEEATGRRPVIYIQPWYWHSYLGRSDELVPFGLWAAGSAPRGRDGWPWTFWQHGQPAHWDARVWDRDLFHGEPAELHEMIKAAATSPRAR